MQLQIQFPYDHDGHRVYDNIALCRIYRTNKHRKTSYIPILITVKCIAMPFYLLFFVLKGHTRLLNSTLLRLNRIRAPFTTPSVKSSRLISVDEKRGMSSLSSLQLSGLSLFLSDSHDIATKILIMMINIKSLSFQICLESVHDVDTLISQMSTCIRTYIVSKYSLLRYIDKSG